MTTNVQTDKITTTSADITQDRLDQLRRLLPEAFTEGRVDFDKLRAALGHHVDDSPERYAFTWAGKRNAIRLAPAPDGGYHLDVQLKLRDPQQDWRGWQYEPDGNNIRREWVTAYHFPTLDGRPGALLPGRPAPPRRVCACGRLPRRRIRAPRPRSWRRPHYRRLIPASI
jgi:hypothetical protein